MDGAGRSMQHGNNRGFGEVAGLGAKNCKEMAMDEFVVKKGLRHGNPGRMDMCVGLM